MYWDGNFQTGIILFYISMGAKKGSTIPIISGSGHHDVAHAIHAADYANPLTQILMLTAIVVGVATLGLLSRWYNVCTKEHGTTNEDEILESLS